MRLIAKQIDALEKIDVPLSKQDDFDSFWEYTLEKVDKHNPELKMKELSDYPLKEVTVYNSVFHGLDQTPIKTWILLPGKVLTENVPVIVWFHGGNRSREEPFNHLYWLAAGFAVIAMDFRQQGGQTGSNTPMTRCGGHSFSVMNIENYKSYYLYHAWTDALIAIKLAEMVPGIDREKVAVAGSSQGGGTALVMAALNHQINFCLAAVPSFCWWEKRISIRSGCAKDIAAYIEKNPDNIENVYRTMSYYDVINFVDKIKCPVVFSCGFNDQDTPASCVYAAYNKISSKKIMHNYPAGGHTLEPKEIENWLRFATASFM